MINFKSIKNDKLSGDIKKSELPCSTYSLLENNASNSIDDIKEKFMAGNRYIRLAFERFRLNDIYKKEYDILFYRMKSTNKEITILNYNYCTNAKITVDEFNDLMHKAIVILNAYIADIIIKEAEITDVDKLDIAKAHKVALYDNGYKNISELEKLSMSDLAAIKGISNYGAREIYHTIRFYIADKIIKQNKSFI